MKPANSYQTWQCDCLSYQNASRINFLDLTLNQGHTHLNHENNNCLIISETVHAMPIKFAVKIIWPAVHNHSSVRWTSPSLKVTTVFKLLFLTCTIILIVISCTIFKPWHSNWTKCYQQTEEIPYEPHLPLRTFPQCCIAHAHFDDLDLDAWSQWLGRGKNSVLNYLDK